MSESSLIVLAVKRAMTNTISEASSDRYSTFYTHTSLESNTFPLSSATDFLDYTISDCMDKLSKNLASEKDKIIANLEIIRDLDALEDGAASATAINQVFDKNKGKMFTFMYSFVPNEKTKEVTAEQLSLSFKCQLADKIVVLYHSKKTFFGKRTVTEETKIPAVISKSTVVFNLAIAFAPLVNNRISAPSIIMKDLKEQAQSVKNTIPNDTHRMVYDPVNRMSVLVTDPEVLKLIPTKWEKVIFETTTVPAKNDYAFEF